MHYLGSLKLLGNLAIIVRGVATDDSGGCGSFNAWTVISLVVVGIAIRGANREYAYTLSVSLNRAAPFSYFRSCFGVKDVVSVVIFSILNLSSNSISVIRPVSHPDSVILCALRIESLIPSGTTLNEVLLRINTTLPSAKMRENGNK